MWLSCCKCILISGILFYISIGFIILGQVQFLKFDPVDTTSSIGACFITATIYFVLFIIIYAYQRYSKVTKFKQGQPNYYDLSTERDTKWRQNGFKGAQSPELKAIRNTNNSKMMRQQ